MGSGHSYLQNMYGQPIIMPISPIMYQDLYAKNLNFNENLPVYNELMDPIVNPMPVYYPLYQEPLYWKPKLPHINVPVEDAEQFLAGIVDELLQVDDFQKIKTCLTDATGIQ